MIVEALKSSVISGPKIRNGDSAALLTLSVFQIRDRSRVKNLMATAT